MAILRRIFQLRRDYGRLGNQIQQRLVGVACAIKHCGSFRSHENEYFNRIRFDAEELLGWLPCTSSGRFFFTSGMRADSFDVDLSIDDFLFAVRVAGRNVVRQSLKVDWTRSYPFEHIPHLHLRSGDLFPQAEVRVESTYAPNPAAFYDRVLTPGERIIVVTEPDYSHPLLKWLESRYEASLRSSTVLEDFFCLARSKRLITSGVGTFAISAAMISPSCRRVDASSLYLSEHLNVTHLPQLGISVTVTSLPSYPTLWANTAQDRDRLISYKLP